MDESESNEQLHSEENSDTISYRKWSRYSSVSQSTDATLTSASTRSLEAVLENKMPFEMCELALDNLSKWKSIT